MRADRAEDVRIALGDGQQVGVTCCTRVEIVTMRLTPAVARARDDRVELVGEIGEIQVAVAVDKHDGQAAASVSGST